MNRNSRGNKKRDGNKGKKNDPEIKSELRSWEGSVDNDARFKQSKSYYDTDLEDYYQPELFNITDIESSSAMNDSSYEMSISNADSTYSAFLSEATVDNKNLDFYESVSKARDLCINGEECASSESDEEVSSISSMSQDSPFDNE